MTTTSLRELKGTWDARDWEGDAVIEPRRRVRWGTLLTEGYRLAAEIQDCSSATAPVAVDCGRSAECVTAVVGCLLAQRPFLLLDEELPVSRRQWILADSNAATIITRGLDQEPGAGGALSLVTSCGIGPSPPRKTHQFEILAEEDLERILYRIYTSGSTGHPKGAAVPARSIYGLLPALLKRVLPLATTRCIGVSASLGFDAALQQIFLGLFTGATLAVASTRVVRAVDSLIEFWRNSEVDLADATPTLMRMLAAAPASCGRSLPLRTLLVGGEVMRGEDPARLWSRFGSELEIFNLYGVAECGIDATAHKVGVGDEAEASVPVGESLEHCHAFIADRDGRELPDGETGDLFIGGEAVGAGYPADPVLTQERFLSREGEVVYRTGDLARKDPDRGIVVQGRLDRQMKVGGRRFDPGELEHLLADWMRDPASRPRISADPAVVMRCRACVLSVAHPDADIDTSGLCRFCRTLDRGVAAGWGHFRSRLELDELLKTAKGQSSGQHDAVLLFSGGKDSTYALYRLHDLGVRVFAFTFDNGFISPAAVENIERIVARLGVDHRFLSARDNRALLAESLRVEATVCTGCFKGITLLGAQLAREIGAPIMISGLSRGQIIETKLLQFLRRGRDDLTDVDGELEDHLSIYLGRHDVQFEAVGAHPTETSAVIPLVDYFRYDDTAPAEIMNFLAARDPAWLSPDDTGVCSSNCRANDIGIAEHLARRGFHNYESPISWDVRLGMISREEALRQVASLPAEDSVSEGRRILDQRCEVAVVQGERGELLALLQGGGLADTDGLGDWLGTRVPAYMHPARVEIVSELPRLPSDKVDYGAVRSLFDSSSVVEPAVLSDEMERRIGSAWQRVLGSLPSSRDSIFFDEGGDSLAATELAIELKDEFEVPCEVGFVFETPSPAGMAERIRRLLGAGAAGGSAGMPRESVRVTAKSTPAQDDVGAAVVVMPGLLGGAGPLLPLCEGIGRIVSSPVLVAEFEPRVAWGGEPSVAALAAEMAEGLRSHDENLLIVGWSFGAILAEHVAALLEASHSRRGQIQACLIDPPANLAEELSEMQLEVVAGLRAGLPQFRPQLDDDDLSWAQIALLIERAGRYRGGTQKILSCIPTSMKRHLARPDAQGAVTENLLNLTSAFWALSDFGGSLLPDEAPGVKWTVIQSSDHPLGATTPLHPVHERLSSWVTINTDHNGVLNPCHLQQYSKLLQFPLTS